MACQECVCVGQEIKQWRWQWEYRAPDLNHCAHAHALTRTHTRIHTQQRCKVTQWCEHSLYVANKLCVSHKQPRWGDNTLPDQMTPNMFLIGTVTPPRTRKAHHNKMNNIRKQWIYKWQVKLVYNEGSSCEYSKPGDVSRRNWTLRCFNKKTRFIEHNMFLHCIMLEILLSL